MAICFPYVLDNVTMCCNLDFLIIYESSLLWNKAAAVQEESVPTDLQMGNEVRKVIS